MILRNILSGITGIKAKGNVDIEIKTITIIPSTINT